MRLSENDFCGRSPRWTFFYRKAFALTAFGFSLAFAAATAAGDGLLGPVAAPLSAEKQLQLEADPYVKRWRIAQIDSDAIFSAPPTSDPLAFPLFPDVHLQAQVQSAKTLESGSTFLHGTIEGGGHFSLLRHGSGIVVGEFESTRGAYVLSPGAKSNLVLVKQQEVRLLSCGVGRSLDPVGALGPTLSMRRRGPDAVTRPTTADHRGRSVVPPYATPSSRRHSKSIDILVLYEQRLEEIQEGPIEFAATVELHVAYANQVIENSGLSHRKLRIVAMEKVEMLQNDDQSLVLLDRGDDTPGKYNNSVIERAMEHGAEVIYRFVPQAILVDHPYFEYVSGIAGSGVGVIHGNSEYFLRVDCQHSENYALCLKTGRRDRLDLGNAASVLSAGGRTFSHEIGHVLGALHDRYTTFRYEYCGWNPDSCRETPYARPADEIFVRALGQTLHGRDQRDYSPAFVVGNFGHIHVYGSSHCASQLTIMSYRTLHGDRGCSASNLQSVPYYSNPTLDYPRPVGRTISNWVPNVAMGVAGNERAYGVDGPVNATRSIDLAWDLLAELNDPPMERLPNACNEGDIAHDILAESMPASIDAALAGESKSFAISLSAPEACADDVILRVRSEGAKAWPGSHAPRTLSTWPSEGHFDVSARSEGAGARHRLEITASDDHYGACSAARRSLAVVELTDHVKVDWDHVLQKVPGTRRHGIALQQSAAHSFCRGAPTGQLRRMGDFNGDGKAGVLLRHADGAWLYYRMDGPNAQPGVAVSLPRTPAMSVAGIGDLNGDGKDDVLMRLADGSWRYFPMDGPRVLPDWGQVALPTDLAWEVEGIGDFNGDGKDDVLMRRVDGEYDTSPPFAHYADYWRFYLMDGRTVRGEVVPAGLYNESTASTWVAGVGDFNGDGREDTLLRRTNGTWHYFPFHIYAYQGQLFSALDSGHGAVALTDDLAWTAAGIADFNGDGKDDVLLRHEDGRWLYQPMDGKELLEGTGVPELPADPEIWLAGVGDMNGDGLADVLTRRGHEAWEYWPAKPFSWIATPFGGYRYDEGRPDLNPGEVDLASGPAWGVLKGGVEDPPRVRAQLLDQPLAIGSDAALDLSLYFSDGQALTFNVASSDTDVVRVSVADNVLTLAPVADGRATVAVTARDADGYVVRQTFQTAVSEDGQVGRRFRDCPECPEMVVVPAGSFMMGSPEEEEGGPRSDQRHERPQHRVDFAAPFAIGVFEVTYEQWNACVADGGCRDDVERHSFDETGPNHPVYRVNWNDAQAYVEWLAAKTGQAYRLPSDAEWEYAARAGTTTPFHFGETITTDQANYDGEVPSSRRYEGDEASSYALANPGIYRGGPVPVGSLPANPWGLHEVHGNVTEWTRDCFDNVGYAGWPADGSAVESGDCDKRYLRNGSFYDDPGDVRSARRKVWSADFLYGFSGFRVAKTLED